MRRLKQERGKDKDLPQTQNKVKASLGNLVKSCLKRKMQHRLEMHVRGRVVTEHV